MLEPSDLAQLRELGIAVSEVERQLALFVDPPPPTRLVRPCRLEDGIRRLAGEDHPSLLARWRQMAQRGRLLKFVPASGAASRMFRDLEWLRAEPQTGSPQELESRAAGGEERASNCLRFLRELESFAFYRHLAEAVSRTGREIAELQAAGDLATLAHYTLSAEGLGYADLPKGLIDFHAYPSGSRTAFAEHLVEGRGYLGVDDGVCRLHFTVSAEHREAFRSSSEQVAPALQEAVGARFEVSFSTQRPSGDTLAVDPENRPFRTSDGRLLFRPGGHGALIDNLERLGGDVVILKNIDNIAHQRLHGLGCLWKRLLIGYLGELESRAFDLLAALEERQPEAGKVDEALAFLARSFAIEVPAGLGPEARQRLAVDRLRRPLRVCGVVRNRGEPGGGPFWVKDSAGEVSGQIVESAQIDDRDPEQQAIWRASTHFNPVDVVCGLRDRRGEPHDLAALVDPSTAFVADKTFDGRPLRALERPGLWNGAMAGWNTAFIEVPEETFSPVKTILDLLRPPHQP